MTYYRIIYEDKARKMRFLSNHLYTENELMNNDTESKTKRDYMLSDPDAHYYDVDSWSETLEQVKPVGKVKIKASMI